MDIKALPAWLKEKEPARELPRGKAGRAFERTLKGVLGFFEDTLFNETVSEKAGFLQHVEPRLKMITVLALIVALSFKKTIPGMLPFGLFAMVMAMESRVPLLAYFKRLLPGAAFTAVIALPALFITKAGALAAAMLFIRVVESLMLVFLIGFTTRPAVLVKSAGAFLPGVLRTLLSISYRYIFYLARRLEEFLFAQRARGTRAGVGFSERKWAGGRAASLLLVSMRLKDELQMAMEARGMSYSQREFMEKFRFGIREAALLAAAAVTILL